MPEDYVLARAQPDHEFLPAVIDDQPVERSEQVDATSSAGVSDSPQAWKTCRSPKVTDRLLSRASPSRIMGATNDTTSVVSGVAPMTVGSAIGEVDLDPCALQPFHAEDTVGVREDLRRPRHAVHLEQRIDGRLQVEFRHHSRRNRRTVCSRVEHEPVRASLVDRYVGNHAADLVEDCGTVIER
jgi:hypothetical protein